MLRCSLTAQVASSRSSDAIGVAVAGASALSKEFATLSGNTTIDVPAAGFAISFATFAVDAALVQDVFSAAYTAGLTVIPLSSIFASQSADALAIQSGIDPLTLPLWHNDTPPDWFTTAEAAMRTYWQTNNPTHWSFWQRWYDAAVAGNPLDWHLQRDIALIPDEIWQSGPGPVAEAIARIESEHKNRVPENSLTAELRDLPKPSSTQVAITRAAMEQNRACLPPTFDAIEGLILLEIEHLQQRNYTDDLDQAEARRQIRIFVTLYDAICALRRQLPATAPVTEEQAARSVSLVSLYANKFADLPRMKADEVVEGIWSTGRGAVQASLIGTTTLLGVSYGLPAIAALTIGAMVFAPKNAVDLIKAGREALTPKP